MTTPMPSATVTWADRLQLSGVADERQALLDAMAAAAPDGKVVIQAASVDDYLARQLIAAARATAAQLGLTVDASTPDGPWPEGTAPALPDGTDA